MALMSKPKKPVKPKSDRHKPRKMVGIRKQFHEPGAELIKILGLNGWGELANIALREMYERHGVWPWPPKDASPES